MKIGLIIIGDEILSGKRQDKHFPVVLKTLQDRGLALSWVNYLGDDHKHLTESLRLSFGRGDLVFSCGGIGATPDDRTRQAAAAALGRSLVLHPEAEKLITQRCADMAAEGKGSADMSLPENRQRLKMGEFPEGARIIPNPFNRIPGFSVHDHHFLPGFPVMAWPMIELTLDAHYSHLFHRERIAEKAFWVFDLPESVATPLLESIESRYPGIKTFSLPSAGANPARRHIELGVKGPAEQISAPFEELFAGISALGAQTTREAPGDDR
ncbi:MAG: molybdopterin-binding protein [Burkholderiaceae bacterium]